MGIFETLNLLNYGDLISGLGHERLRGIEINHSYGSDTRAKGWNTYLDVNGNEIQVPESINSSSTPFRPLILLVPPELIGTHEATNPIYVPSANEDQRGFSGLNFDSGWHGSPIAVAAFTKCKGNEIIDNAIYTSLSKALSAKGGVGILSDMKYGDLGVLDGHHRRKMAAEGYPLLRYIPVQLIPYLADSSVVLDTWHDDREIWTAENVFKCFKNKNQYTDSKRTKFGIIGTDGVTRRILDAQPEIHIPLENLI